MQPSSRKSPRIYKAASPFSILLFAIILGLMGPLIFAYGYLYYDSGGTLWPRTFTYQWKSMVLTWRFFTCQVGGMPNLIFYGLWPVCATLLFVFVYKEEVARAERARPKDFFDPAHPPIESNWGKEGDCPACGASYNWDGIRCLHCGFVSPKTAPIGPAHPGAPPPPSPGDPT